MNREFSRQEYGVRTAEGVVASYGTAALRGTAGSCWECEASPLALIRGEQ
jgi:hypothetical protein